MNLTILLSHESDERATNILSVLSAQVAAERLATFADVRVAAGPFPEFHQLECEWSRPGSATERRTVVSLLADIGPLTNLRLVALATSVDRDVAEALGAAHEALRLGCQDALSGAETAVATARVGVVGRREERPHELFFSPEANHNLIVLPYDRFDDSMAADAVTSEDEGRFAAHGAVDLGSLCGLWAPMNAAPIDAGVMGAAAHNGFGIRLVQSRVRSLQAPTVSLHELFGEDVDALPVPHRYVEERKLASDTIDALAAALLAEAEGFHFYWTEQDQRTLDQETLLSVLFNVLKNSLKEAPAALSSLVRGEVDSVIRLALQEIVDPDARVEVMSPDGRPEAQPSAHVSISPWDQARLTDELTSIPAAVWTELVEKFLALIGGDPAANDIRSVVLGSPDRVPSGRADLLDGLETLPGSLPRFALGDSSVTLLGKARSAELRAPSRFDAAFMPDDLLSEIVEEFDRVVESLAEHDNRLSEAFSQARPYDWSGNVLTMVFGDGANAKTRRALERLEADAMIRSVLLSVVGAEPALINWIDSENEFRPMIVPAPVSGAARDGDSEATHSAGLLMRIGERILEQRAQAEAYLNDRLARLREIETGEYQFRVQPAIYALMALGAAGLLFELLTSPIAEELMARLPSPFVPESLYTLVVIAALFGSAALTDIGKQVGAQIRFVLLLASWVFTTGVVVLFGISVTGSSLTALHVVIGILILVAWFQAIGAESNLRITLIRMSAVVYGLVVVLILAVLTNRGAGPLGLLPDPQTELRVGLLLEWTSRALVVGGFLVLAVSRGRARVRLEREARDLEWLNDECLRARQAYETLGLAYIQWNVTACSLAQLIRQPYGPLVSAAARAEPPKIDGIRRASFADLTLTNRGADLLRSELRQKLVYPGWLKQQYSTRVNAFLALEAERQQVTLGEARERPPETDPIVATPDELVGRAAIRSGRLLFAELGDRGVFDTVCSAPIADEALLELLDPVFREPEAQRISGAPSGLGTAFDFLMQAGPSMTGPSVPNDEVLDFERRKVAVDRSMQQLLWWPKFVPQPRSGSTPLVEDVPIRWIGGGPAHGSTSVQLLAVRVDYSPLYDYSTLRFGVQDEVAGENPQVFDSSSSGGVLG